MTLVYDIVENEVFIKNQIKFCANKCNMLLEDSNINYIIQEIKSRAKDKLIDKDLIAKVLSEVSLDLSKTYSKNFIIERLA